MNAYYIVCGIENSRFPFSVCFSLSDLLNNEGTHKDSEMFYALRELHGDDIIGLKVEDAPLVVKVSRDNNGSMAILVRSHHPVNTETSFH